MITSVDPFNRSVFIKEILEMMSSSFKGFVCLESVCELKDHKVFGIDLKGRQQN